MNITANERLVLRALRTNDFGNGTQGDWLWSDCINDAREPSGITGSALGGVVSSLCEKGLAETDGNKGRDACIRLTEAGWAAAS